MISAACLATSVLVGPPIAIPTSAFRKAAASFTPSPAKKIRKISLKRKNLKK